MGFSTAPHAALRWAERPRPPRFYLEVFGCQMNVLDGEVVENHLARAGYARAARPEDADVVLFNTCSVRAHAEERAISRMGALRRLRRDRPEVVFGILGCMAQKEQARLFRRLPHLDLVCGSGEYGRLASLVEDVRGTRRRVVAASFEAPWLTDRDPRLRPHRHRAFVSIQRGYNQRCTYCVVPSVKGREVSRAIPDVVAEVRRLAEDGCREIVLLGQTVNAYGRDRQDGTTIAGLLESLQDVPGIARIRFTAPHPRFVTEDLLRCLRDLPSVCEFLHLPMQSGATPVLRRMLRGYTASEYRGIVDRAREVVPGLELASDFIVGFPGETEAQFQETLVALREIGYLQAFLFKYSPREGTAAFALPDDVPGGVKRERHDRLLRAQEAGGLDRHLAYVGRTVEVLVDGPSRRDPRRWSGRTRGNAIVVFEDPRDLAGRLVDVRIDAASALTLFGAPVTEGS